VSRADDDDAGVARIEERRMTSATDDAERLRAMRTKRERRA
jgi:hypothetical protein